MATKTKTRDEIHIVFDGPPGPESGRFIEVEDKDGRGIRVGRWEERSPSIDGPATTYWHLIIGPEAFEEPV